jgi:hypothetical protein
MEFRKNTKYEHVIELCAKYLYKIPHLRVEVFTLHRNDTINNIEIKIYIYIYIYIYTPKTFAISKISNHINL